MKLFGNAVVKASWGQSVNFVFTNITAQEEAKITLTLPVAGPTLQKVKR